MAKATDIDTRRSCRDCRFADFQRTPTGRIKKGVAGTCKAVTKADLEIWRQKIIRDLPNSVSSPGFFHKVSIWPEYKHCSIWEGIESPCSHNA